MMKLPACWYHASGSGPFVDFSVQRQKMAQEGEQQEQMGVDATDPSLMFNRFCW
ncbi:MAG: hypothetical protein R2788_20155 [Saprospiraceae bacterium]